LCTSCGGSARILKQIIGFSLREENHGTHTGGALVGMLRPTA
jgi:hypothetical protein